MRTTLAVISVLGSVAFAQNALPTGISSGCSTFLDTLNKDASLNTCTAPIVSATTQYSNGSKASASAIASTLSNICGSKSCSKPTIRSQLAAFYQACNAELTNNVNKDVLQIYEVLYSILPMKDAMCAKDETTTDYCLTKSAPAMSAVQQSTGMNVDQIQKALASDGALDSSAFSAANLPFLFLSPSLAKEALCVPCTRNVLSSYISWENDIAFAPGMAKSVLLSGQKALTDGIVNTCGPNFINGAVQAAGGISGDTISGFSAAPRSFNVELKGLAFAIVGVLTATIAFNA
jgi:hypothetical protein